MVDNLVLSNVKVNGKSFRNDVEYVERALAVTVSGVEFALGVCGEEYEDGVSACRAVRC